MPTISDTQHALLSRRFVLGGGLSLGLAAMMPVPAAQAATPARGIVILHQSLAVTTADNASTILVGADPARPWRQQILPQLKERMQPIIGILPAAQLFVLERFAWDSRLGLGAQIAFHNDGRFSGLAPASILPPVTLGNLDDLYALLGACHAGSGKAAATCQGTARDPRLQGMTAFTLVPRTKALAPYAKVS